LFLQLLGETGFLFLKLPGEAGFLFLKLLGNSGIKFSDFSGESVLQAVHPPLLATVLPIDYAQHQAGKSYEEGNDGYELG